MKPISFFTIFLFLLCIDANAQIITGKVYDSATRLPIANVNVYLNNTSYYAKTNHSGAFSLKVAQKMNTQLIISHVSYETVVINEPFEKESREIYLIEKNYVLNEVVIKRGRFSREEQLKAFEPQFLGDNAAGRSCKILNKDDIDLVYDEDDKTLYATNEQPIIIENKYLGYQIHCSSIDFKACYSDKSLSKRSLKTVLLRGDAFFIDLAPDNPVIKKRRDEAYEGSLNYFFKSLATQTLASSNHVIFNYGDRFPANPYIYFDITDSGSDKIIRINPDTDINKNPPRSLILRPIYRVLGSITVKDPTGYYSTHIIFLTDELTVDSFGIIAEKDYIVITGQMGNLRMGSMVPLDYEIIPRKNR